MIGVKGWVEMKLSIVLLTIMGLVIFLSTSFNMTRIGKLEADQLKTLENLSTLQDQFIDYLKDEIEFKKSLNRAKINRNKGD